MSCEEQGLPESASGVYQPVPRDKQINRASVPEETQTADLLQARQELLELIANPDKSDLQPRYKSLLKTLLQQQKPPQLLGTLPHPNLPPRLLNSQLHQVARMIAPHIVRPGIHMVPMMATREGILVPVNVHSHPIALPPPHMPLPSHPPLPAPPQLPHPPLQPPIARLKPIPLVTETPAAQNPYLKEDGYEEVEIVPDELIAPTPANSR